MTLIIGATAEGASTARLTAILIEAARFGEYRFEPNIITATVTVDVTGAIATVMSEDATGEIPDSLTYELVSTDPSDVAANFSVTKVNRQGRLDIVTAFTSAQTVTAVIGSMDHDGSQATISVVVVVEPAPLRPISFTPSDVTFNLEVGGEVNLPSIGSESLTYTVISADPPAVTDFIEVDTVANPNKINITATALAASLDRSQRQPTTVTLIIGATAEGASTARLTAVLIEAARFGEYRFEPNIITATVTVDVTGAIATVMSEDATGEIPDSLTYRLVSTDPSDVAANFSVTKVNRQGRLDIVTAFTSAQTVTAVIGSMDHDGSQATISVVVVVEPAPLRPISFTPSDVTFNLEVGGEVNLPSIGSESLTYTVISADPPAVTDFIEVDTVANPNKINITATALAASLDRSQRQPTTVTLIIGATAEGASTARLTAVLIEAARFGEYRFEPNIITATVTVDVTGAIATVMSEDATGEIPDSLTYRLVSTDPSDVAANFSVTKVNRQGRLDIVTAFTSAQTVTAVIGSMDPDGSQATISVVVVVIPLPDLDLNFDIVAADDVVGDGSAAEPYVFPSGSGNGYVLATMSVNDAITDEQWIFGSSDSGLQIGSDGIISFNAEPIQDQVQRAIITVAVGGTNAMTMSLHFKRAFDDSTRIFMADGGNGNSGNKLSWLPHDAAAAAASQGGQNSLGVAVRVNPYLSRYGLSGSPDVDAQALAFNNNILYMFGGGAGANNSQLHVINHNTGRITKTFSDRIFGYGSGLTSLDGALYATDFNGGGGNDDELFRIEINGDAVTRTKIGASFNRNPHAITTIENRLYILLRGDSGLYEVTIDGSPIGFLDRFGDGSRIKRIDTNPDTNLNNVSGLVAVQTTLYFLDAELKALWRFEEGSLNARPVRVGSNNINTGGSAAIEEPSGLACFNCPEVTPIVITDTAGAGVTKDDQTYENVPYDLNAVIASLSATGGNGEPYVFSVVSEGDLFRLENNQLMLAPNANNSRPLAAANNTYTITLMVMGEGALDRSVIRNIELGGPLPMGVGSAADPYIIELLDSELTAFIFRDFGRTGYTTNDPLLRVNDRFLQFETSLESNDAQQATIENQVQRVVVNDPDGAEIMIYYKRVYNFETPRMFFVNDDASDDALYWVPHNNDSATAAGIGTADIGKALRVNPYITNMNSADALSPEGLTYHTATLYMAAGGGAVGTAARSTLYAVNINNGVVSDAIVTASINIAKGLASFGGQLYAIDNPVNADGDNLVGDRLYTLNTATGAVNQRGPNLENGNYAGLAAFGNRLFALDNMAGGNASLDELAQINPGSGVEYRENLRQGNDFDNPEALAALGSDLYLIGGNVLYRINRDSSLSSLDNNPDAALVRAGGSANNLGNGISNVKGMACVYCAAVSRVPLVISDVAMGATTGSGSSADSYVAHVDRTDVLIKFTASGGGNAYSYRVTGSEFEIDDSGNIEFLDDFSPANNLYTVTVMALANNASAFPAQKVIYINTFGFSAIGYDTVAADDVVGDGSAADPYVFPSDSGNGYVLATLIVLDSIADEQWTFDSTDSALQIGVSDGVISFNAEPIQDEVQQAIITVAANGEIAMTATLYFKRAFDNAVRLFMVDRISGNSGRLYWVPHNAAAEAASRGGKRGQATRVNRYLNNFGDEVKNPEAITFHDNTLYILAGGDVGNSELHAINHNTGVVISTLQTDLDNGLAMTSLNGTLYVIDTNLASAFASDDGLSRLDINGERVTRTAIRTVSGNPVGLAAVDNDKLYILVRGGLASTGANSSRIFRLILDDSPTVDDFLGGAVQRNDNNALINILSGLVEIANTLYFSSETIPALLRSHVKTADLSGSLRGDILRSVAGTGGINGGNGGGTTVGEIKGLACYCNEDVQPIAIADNVGAGVTKTAQTYGNVPYDLNVIIAALSATGGNNGPYNFSVSSAGDLFIIDSNNQLKFAPNADNSAPLADANSNYMITIIVNEDGEDSQFIRTIEVIGAPLAPLPPPEEGDGSAQDPFVFSSVVNIGNIARLVLTTYTSMRDIQGTNGKLRVTQNGELRFVATLSAADITEMTDQVQEEILGSIRVYYKRSFSSDEPRILAVNNVGDADHAGLYVIKPDEGEVKMVNPYVAAYGDFGSRYNFVHAATAIGNTVYIILSDSTDVSGPTSRGIHGINANTGVRKFAVAQDPILVRDKIIQQTSSTEAMFIPAIVEVQLGDLRSLIAIDNAQFITTKRSNSSLLTISLGFSSSGLPIISELSGVGSITEGFYTQDGPKVRNIPGVDYEGELRDIQALSFYNSDDGNDYLYYLKTELSGATNIGKFGRIDLATGQGDIGPAIPNKVGGALADDKYVSEALIRFNDKFYIEDGDNNRIIELTVNNTTDEVTEGNAIIYSADYGQFTDFICLHCNQ